LWRGFSLAGLANTVGTEIYRFSSKGLLVPDDLTVELWRTKIEAQVLEGEFKPDIDALVWMAFPETSIKRS